VKVPSNRWRTLIGCGVVVFAIVLAVGSAQRAKASAAASGKPVKMAFVIPGPNLYFDNYKNALNDLSGKYKFQDHQYAVGTQWSLSAENVVLNALTSRGFNAIGLFPGDPQATNTQIQAMKRQGVTSILVGGCTNDPSQALFCIATDVYNEAYDGTKALIKKIGGKGNIAHLGTQLTDPNTILRERGVNAAVAETHGKVKMIQFIGDTDTPDAAPRAVASLLASKGTSLAGVVATGWYPTEALAAALTSKPQYRRIVVVGSDASAVTMKALKAGIIYGTEFQNSYGQSYVAGYVLQKVVGNGCTLKKDMPFDTLHMNTKRFIDSGNALITKANAAQFFAMAKNNKGVVPETIPSITAKLLKEADTKWLSCK
jgi:ribose transport system substrate-binding protein